jgi:hypothetical protein
MFWKRVLKASAKLASSEAELAFVQTHYAVTGPQENSVRRAQIKDW